MMPRTAIITGGAGFIGRATAARLLARGYRVVALDILDPQVHCDSPLAMPDGVELVVGDIRDKGLVEQLVGEADFVLHLAAKTGVGQSMYAVSEYADTNV